MTTYDRATASDRFGESVFLHTGDSTSADGRYTWDEIVASAADWGEVIENREPTLVVRHDTEDGPVDTTIDGQEG